MKRFYRIIALFAAASICVVSCNSRIHFDNPDMGGGRDSGQNGGSQDGHGSQGGGNDRYTDVPNPYLEHEWVDLGLSVLWASCNVGADSPEQAGGFYPWGDSRTQSDHYYGWGGYLWYDAPNDALSKYNLSAEFGNVDQKFKLDSSDDSVTKLWGGVWRMPSKSEIQELVSSCEWELVTWKGVQGYDVYSKQTGGSIFIPAAGAWSNGVLENEGCAIVWSSELDVTGESDDSLYGFALALGLYDEGTAGYVRSCGLNLRAVLDPYADFSGGSEATPGEGSHEGGHGAPKGVNSARTPVSSFSGVRRR